MIQSIKQLKSAMRRKRFIGIVIYDGASRIDGQPVIAIATGLVAKSENEKTGAMVQTWILRRDIAPHHAAKSGKDVSVCGDCPLRPAKGGASDCYVRTYQAPNQVWKSYHAGRYAVPGVDFAARLLPELFRGAKIRFGAYGDPYAIPVRRWGAMAKHAGGWTGYTHQWRRLRQGAALSKLCMASADTADDVATANARGWRTFRVKKSNAPILATEFGCPAAKENGQRTNCADCGLCAGSSITARNPVIDDHGSKRNMEK